MPLPSTCKLIVALALALCVAACGKDGPLPTQRVVHLDPRLADGRSPAEALAAVREVVREWRFTDAAAFEAERGVWRVRNGDVQAARGGGPGVGLRLADYDEARGLTAVSLLFQGDLLAADVTAVEVDVIVERDGAGVMRWVPREPRPDDRAIDFRLEAPFAGGNEVQTVRFPLDSIATWRERVVSLDLAPVGGAAAYFELRALRFVRTGFTPGAQPESVFGVDAGDGGLLGVSGDLRRVWPSDVGVPLLADAVLPAGARVTVDVTVPGEAGSDPVPTSVALDVAGADGAWHELARRTLTPPADAGAMAWSSLTGDASALAEELAGESTRVRLRAWKGAPLEPADERTLELGPPDSAPKPEDLAASPGPDTRALGLDGELERASIWWGAPLVLGELHADRRPNVVLVTLDTTRVDALGLYGGPERTPYLDAIGAGGLVFDQAWAPCNSTLPSHTSILTGLHVPAHGLVDNRSQLDPNVETLAQTLRAAGYHTAAAVSVQHLQAGYSGLGRGFDHYLDTQPDAVIDGTPTLDVVDDWLAEWELEGDRPFFLWVHLFDPHTPYGPEAEWLADYTERYGVQVPPRTVPGDDPGLIGRTNYTEPGEFLEGVTNHAYAEYLYQAGVTFADELVGRLDAALERGGAREHTALVITADHGEAMGEGEGTNQIWYDHRMLYDPILHVPLIVRLPGLRTGERVTERVSLVDLAPSLLGLVGVPAPAVLRDGRDLFGPLEEREVHFVHSNNAQVGVKDGAETFFYNTSEYLQLGRELATPAGHRWLFDAQADPAFRTNLAATQAARADLLHQTAESWAASRVQVGGTVRAELTAAASATLDELGYTEDGE